MGTASERPAVDTLVHDRLAEAIRGVLLEYPEVKCVGAAVCWNGDLNDRPLRHTVWVGADPQVNTPDAILGSLHQTLKLFVQQMARGMAYVSFLETRVAQLSQQVKEHHEREGAEHGDAGRPADAGEHPPGRPGG